MHLKWNNTFGRVLASSVAMFMATASLYAIPRGPCDTPPPPVCCEEPKPGPFAFSYPFDMNLNCPRDFYFHVDGLAMQAKQDGMAWAISDSNGLGAPISNGQVDGFTNDHSDWEYNWGARVGAGFYLDHDAWNLDFNWTYLRISDYDRANVTTGGGTMLPQWAVGNDTPENQLQNHRTSAVWDGNYNTLDIRLGKPYHVSRYLVWNPHFGVRAAWIDQHYSVDYSGSNALATSTRWVHHSDNDFWGFGARCGFDSDWILGKGFCLFGNFATSILYGKFDIDQHLTFPINNQGFDLDDDHYMNVPNFEIAVGLGWGKHFDKNKYHVGLRAAYEFHYWWNQLNIRKFFGAAGSGGAGLGGGAYPNDVVSRGDLSLSGFSLRLQFDM